MGTCFYFKNLQCWGNGNDNWETVWNNHFWSNIKFIQHSWNKYRCTRDKLKTTKSWHLPKVNNRNTNAICEICSELTIKLPEQRHWSRYSVFIINLLLWTGFTKWQSFFCWLWTKKILVAKCSTIYSRKIFITV